MKKSKLLVMVLSLALVSICPGCATTSQGQLLASNQSQVQLRQMQTRAFDTTDMDKTMRTIISTLQDLDFVIEKADRTLGAITGSKFVQSKYQGSQVMKATVTVRTRGETQLLVRINAQYGLKAIEKPEPYQDFFISLEKAMFLTAHQVD